MARIDLAYERLSDPNATNASFEISKFTNEKEVSFVINSNDPEWGVTMSAKDALQLLDFLIRNKALLLQNEPE